MRRQKELQSTAVEVNTPHIYYLILNCTFCKMHTYCIFNPSPPDLERIHTCTDIGGQQLLLFRIVHKMAAQHSIPLTET